MKIYIEVAIIDNLVINFLLLYLTSKVFKITGNKLLIFFASLIGTIFAIILPLIRAGEAVLFCLKIMLGVCMVYLALKPKTFKKLVAEFILFFMMTFLLGGLIYAVFELFKIDVYSFVLLTNSAIYPISIFILAVFIFVFLSCKVIKILFNQIKSANKKFKIKISKGNKNYYFQALFDSGNLLQDEKTSLPVCVISHCAFKKIYKEVSLIDLVLKKVVGGLNQAHYISFSTISGSKNNMLVFRPDKLEIFNGKNWISKEIMLGVSLVNFSKKASFDLLLNSMCEV